MLVRDFARQCQAEASAVGAAGYQRLEQRVAQGHRYAGAIVDHVHPQHHAQHPFAQAQAVLAGLGVAAVVAVFAAAGFWWLDGYHLVIQRYYQDVGRTRPYDYWVWADLACLVLCAGPAVAPGLRRAVTGVVGGVWRNPAVRPVIALTLGAALAIAAADWSGLSKAEVERIWLPFAVWLTTAAALLPASTRRWWLLAQALTALVVSHLVMTIW